MGRLEGKVTIVTGGARGSGEVIARRFVAEGATVVIADVRDAEPGDAEYVRTDVTSEADWAALVEHVTARHGGVDVLVNNAAVLLLAPIEHTAVEQYERVFRVNELGVFLGTRAVIEPMRARGGGSIVNISSIDGFYVAPFTSAYAASKFAVRGLAKAAAVELGMHGIRVNTVCPAAGNPEMVREQFPPELRSLTTGDLDRAEPVPPVGRRGTMDDVAWACVYLASDESGFMTGTEILLDGGTTAGMNLMAQMTRRR
jgi:3alpha(or 20beta)-hydroxysteroid dehydrogenase